MAAPVAGTQPLITGKTRLYAIIGDPIEQVKSPEVLNPLMAAAGTAGILVPVHIAPADLVTAIRGLQAIANLDGIVITVPHKVRMLELVDDVLPTGRRVGAINAVRREPGGRWVGDNFDGKGFVAGLRNSGHEPRGRRALLVGAGGAGSAVGFALAEAGVVDLTVADLDGAKAERLARGIAAAFPAAGAHVGAAAAAGYELVVNATPIGMAPGDPSPIDPAGFKPGMVVADVIILAHDTPLLAAARQRGCGLMGGRPMTEGQAHEMARFLGMSA
jgi:shikimate dehydrogenase